MAFSRTLVVLGLAFLLFSSMISARDLAETNQENSQVDVDHYHGGRGGYGGGHGGGRGGYGGGHGGGRGGYGGGKGHGKEHGGHRKPGHGGRPPSETEEGN